jgi:hypothetical protein
MSLLAATLRRQRPATAQVDANLEMWCFFQRFTL